MRKIFTLIILFIFCLSCSSIKTNPEVWLGKNKNNLIKSWGTPIRTLSNEKDGEILIYADQIYSDSDSRIAGPNYWEYMYVYVNPEGKIISLKNEKQNLPPQAIDSRKLIGQSYVKTF